MDYVEPIRDITKVNDIADYLKRTNPRNFIMFRVGIFTGLRISDILKLKVKDVNPTSKYITLRETKTRKQKIIKVNKNLRKDLDWYCEGKPSDQYLIRSREGANKPISRDMALKIIKKTCNDFGVENTGTHTLRKTFGYHYYKKTKDIALLQKLFNHSSPSVTLRYIGIVQDSLNDALENFSY